MEIVNINDNKLILFEATNHNIINNKYIMDILVEKQLDSAIIYKNIHENIYNIYILERDGSYSTMCGNGCIALCRKLKHNIKLVNSENDTVFVEYNINNIILNLHVKMINNNTYLIGGEPHKIYFVDRYEVNYHKKIGRENIPQYNTTFITKEKNKYIYSTFERGVNEITSSCGTGSFGAIHYINNILKKNISKIFTLDNKIYKFIYDNSQYKLIFYNG